LAPLAWAFRTAGHEVTVGSQPALLPVVRRSGLPAVALGADDDIADPLRRLQRQDPRRPGPGDVSRTVARYEEMAEAMADPMIALVESWRPDLVVFEECTYAAPLVARRYGIPAVRHLWGVDVMSFVRWSEERCLSPLADRLGLDDVDVAGVATVDPCPPPLQVDSAYRRLRTWYIPYNGGGAVPAWLAWPAHHRPRVCVTYGRTLSTLESYEFAPGRIVEALAGLDVEVIGALSADDRARLGRTPDNVRLVRDIPLHGIVDTCDLVVSHGGPGTALTAAATGVPQLLLPQVGDQKLVAHLLSAAGAGAELPPTASVDVIRERAAALLCDTGYRDAADGVRRDARAQASPARAVAELVDLVRSLS
jgi:UDP:flavonoid glycosyltransferase YjiC (YdhE family)